jgi:hypothetical protein
LPRFLRPRIVGNQK